MAKRIKCEECDDGFFLTHDPDCEGDCMNCPMVTQCVFCNGQGYVDLDDED